MPELHFPWLELSVLAPLLGGIAVGLLRNRERASQLSLGICLLAMVFAVGAWIDFSILQAFEARDQGDVICYLFRHSVLVVDELSAPLLPLAALMYFLIVLSTLRSKASRFSYGWTLLSQAILQATLCCRDPWWLIMLLALAIVPPWIELMSRGRSARIYLFHMGLFLSLLLVGQWLVERGSVGSTSPLAGGTLLTCAALLRSGIVPLHCWMTDLFEKATFGTAILFVTPMTGAYALMRLVLPVAPDWALQSVAIVSLITAVYAGGMALVQREARRFFCYLFLSHSSLVLVGIELVAPLGLTGALCVWVSVGLSLVGFGITLRSIESRIGRVSLAEYQGLYDHTPTLAALFLLTGLASIGFPGTIGFIGTELLIEGAATAFPLIGMTVVMAAALNGIAVLRVYFRIFTGARHSASFSLRARLPERIAVLILVALIIGGGLFPQPGVSSRYHAAQALIHQRQQALIQSEKEGSNNALE